MKMTNAEIARSLREMALFLEMEGVPFKPQAYERAAYAIGALDRPVESIHRAGGVRALQEVQGVGKGIASRVAEMLEQGRSSELEKMKSRVPADILALTSIEGLGPRRVKALWEGLGIRSIEDLEAAAREGRLDSLAGFGKMSQSKVLESISAWRRRMGRWPMGRVLPLAKTIEARLREVRDVESASVAGSLRRLKTTIGDLDFLVVTSSPAAVMDVFASMPEVEHVYAHGPTKTLVRLSQGVDADLRVVPKESFGSALQYFTGSKAHNVALRKIAISKGFKLSEYGLFRGNERVAGRTEREVYETLGLPFVPPELREDQGEIEAAASGHLPLLIEAGTLRGDLQVHTHWTDGRSSIEKMAEAARELGLEYIAITDHTKDLAMTGGLNEDDLLRQARLIRRLDGRVPGIHILAGSEVNIRRDGTLDISDEALKELDIVGAAVHSHFSMPRSEATRRLIRAMENPNVDVIFHPTGRHLGRRDPLDVDMEAIIEAALRTGTILEIDAQPDRLDLDPQHIRLAVSRGLKLVIDSDAHDTGELRFPEEYGIGLARRGWASGRDVLNTRPLAEMLKEMKGRTPRERARLDGRRPQRRIARREKRP